MEIELIITMGKGSKGEFILAIHGLQVELNDSPEIQELFGRMSHDFAKKLYEKIHDVKLKKTPYPPIIHTKS